MALVISGYEPGRSRFSDDRAALELLPTGGELGVLNTVKHKYKHPLFF